MKEETIKLIQLTLVDARDFNLEIEVLCSIIDYTWYGARGKEEMKDEVVQNACISAKKEWDI